MAADASSADGLAGDASSTGGVTGDASSTDSSSTDGLAGDASSTDLRASSTELFHSSSVKSSTLADVGGSLDGRDEAHSSIFCVGEHA